MRVNSQEIPEILSATEDDGHYFAFVRLQRHNEQKCFRFGASREGYLALTRVLQARPFDQLPGLRHRYFFVPSVQRLGNERAMMSVRVEQGMNAKQIDTEAPIDLVANLMWFYQLDDWDKAEHLAVSDPRLS